jgi:hypothetical protein
MQSKEMPEPSSRSFVLPGVLIGAAVLLAAWFFWG